MKRLVSQKELMRKNAICLHKIILGVFLVFLAGCSAVLVRDEAPPPIENGQNRIETFVCGHYAVGNNVCWVGSQTRPGDVSFHIVTYLSGRLAIKSSGAGCQIDEAIRFTKGQVIDLDLSKYLQSFQKSCIVDLMMVVEFPGQDDTDVPIRGLSGRVVLAYSDLGKAPISSDKVTAPVTRPEDDEMYAGVGLLTLRQQQGPYNGPERIRIGTDGSKRGKIRIDGCGLQPLMFDYANENPYVGLNVILRDKVKVVDNCQLVGRVLRLDMNDDLVFVLNLEVYSIKTVLLEEPSVVFSGDEARFEGPPQVSWTFVDMEAVNGTKGKADTMGRTFTIRQLTAIGRTSVTRYEDGNVVWSR